MAKLMVVIDIAHLQNASELAALSGQLGYPTTTEQLSSRLQEIRLNPDHAVFVALLPDGKIVGWIHVFSALFLESEPFAEVGGLIVDEMYRSAGIGENLLRNAEQWAITRGLKQVRVRSNVKRELAHQFYHRMGYSRTKTQIVFDKQLKTNNV